MDSKKRQFLVGSNILWCFLNTVVVLGLSIPFLRSLLSTATPRATLRQFDVTHQNNETQLDFYIQVDNPNKYRSITHNLAWIDVWYNNGSSNHHVYWAFAPRYATQEMSETIYWNMSLTVKPDDGDFLWETDAEKLRKREGYFYVSLFSSYKFDILIFWLTKTEHRLWVDLQAKNFSSSNNNPGQLTATNITFTIMKNFDLAGSSEIAMKDS